MTRRDRRKYLPAEAYRFLALMMLTHRGDKGTTKGELAWQIRANHYMATRVLRDLSDEGLIDIQGDPERGFLIRVTREGIGFLQQNLEYWRRTFASGLRDHFRFGRAPAWLLR